MQLALSVMLYLGIARIVQPAIPHAAVAANNLAGGCFWFVNAVRGVQVTVHYVNQTKDATFAADFGAASVADNTNVFTVKLQILTNLKEHLPMQTQFVQSQAKELQVKVSPSVWNRLMFWAHNQKGLEVSVMGLVEQSCLAKGNIEVGDITMLSQECSEMNTDMDDDAMNAYYEKCFTEGKSIGEFGCVWLHTHPSNNCTPSSTDEETFSKAFSRHPWALMLILGKSGDMSGRIKNNFPRIEQEVEVIIDWANWAEDTVSPKAWAIQYDEKVREKAPNTLEYFPRYNTSDTDIRWVDFSPFTEDTGRYRSEKRCLARIREIERYAKRKDTPLLYSERNLLLTQMEKGTLYESEVKTLLWLNWYLRKSNKASYPTNWATFVEQEGFAFHYTKKGPEYEFRVVEDDFSVGLLPVNTSPNAISGAACSSALIIEAVAHGRKIESGGEVFFEFNGALYHPRLSRVMVESETEGIIAAATSKAQEPLLELEAE